MNIRQVVFGVVVSLVSGMIAGCANVDRVVIDGEAAQRIGNMINEQVLDSEQAFRGNSAGNMRNGAYVLQEDRDIWYLHRMEFDDGSYVQYLQHLLVSQIGSVTARNDLLVPFTGIMAGIVDENLFFIDHDNGDRVSVLDLASLETAAVSEGGSDSLHLFDGVAFWSDRDSGDVWRWDLRMPDDPAVVASEAGRLVGISGNTAYTIQPYSDGKVLNRVDLETGHVAALMMGGPYAEAEVSGSWIYYLSGNKLMRQKLSGGNAVSASMLDVSEYVLCGQCMAIVSPAGGIFVASLDGSGITQVSRDPATGLQMAGDWLFYRNGNDLNRVYAIDLAEGHRSAMVGETLTDGGICFEPVPEDTAHTLAVEFGGQIEAARDIVSYGDQYSGNLSGDVLFAEIPYDGSPVVFHRLAGEDIAADTVGALVIITYDKTVLGQYTDGKTAYRMDTRLTLFEPGHPVPFLTWIVEGRPPSEIKHGAGDRTGLPLSWHQKALDLLALIAARSS